MNQQQTIIGRLKAKGYLPAQTTKEHVIMTRPVGNEHTGQVIFNDGEIQTLRSVDAVRAINQEEINMPSYTRNQILKMPEKQRTALYNEAAGKTVARMRDKDKAADAILKKQSEATAVIKVSQHNSDPAPSSEGTKVDLKATDKPIKPCQLVHALCDQMVGAERKDVIAACVAQGVNKGTAATQYQKWRKKNESNETA